MFNWLFRREDNTSRKDVRQALDRIVEVAPQVRLASRYESRIGAVIGKTLDHAQELVAALPAPRDATPGAWADDPYLRAKFATPDDIVKVIGESRDVRAWFDDNIAADHTFAVLGATLAERRVLVSAVENGVMRTDVARTAVSFDDKRVRFCSETDEALRQELVQRIVEQFALEAMSRVEQQEARRDVLKEHRALLAARMQMLGRRGAGFGSLIASTDLSGDSTRLQRDFEENDAALAALGSLTDSIEAQLQTIIDLLAEPAALISLTHRELCLNQMNLLMEERCDGPHADIAIVLAHLPTQPPQIRAVEIVRIARRDVPPAGAAFDEAARLVL
ncbi:hypothetical protein NOV72_00781 [Caballeronia novacaledonica]|uniref:Uncharacterized protein n=1 Tax=Caballeronia novacaledonica TaxID=1544861 RepID=A0A2U3I092_9BURK|nr:hypothetical protein [Caballeronia novacaledonica]SPB13517.1 hypothetical protein NOV72_00781 [Caballeronia novacaledonica]